MKAKHTPGPWLDEDGTWLYEPQKLLTNTADAWLMGTAPDLLAACRSALGDLRKRNVVDNDLFHSLRATIAKAEGGVH